MLNNKGFSYGKSSINAKTTNHIDLRKPDYLTKSNQERLVGSNNLSPIVYGWRGTARQ